MRTSPPRIHEGKHLKVTAETARRSRFSAMAAMKPVLVWCGRVRQCMNRLFAQRLNWPWMQSARDRRSRQRSSCPEASRRACGPVLISQSERLAASQSRALSSWAGRLVTSSTVSGALPSFSRHKRAACATKGKHAASPESGRAPRCDAPVCLFPSRSSARPPGRILAQKGEAGVGHLLAHARLQARLVALDRHQVSANVLQHDLAAHITRRQPASGLLQHGCSTTRGCENSK